MSYIKFDKKRYLEELIEKHTKLYKAASIFSFRKSYHKAIMLELRNELHELTKPEGKIECQKILEKPESNL